jgi:hypothetical protein
VPVHWKEERKAETEGRRGNERKNAWRLNILQIVVVYVMWRYHNGRLVCFCALSYQYHCDLWVVFIIVIIALSHSPIRHTVNAPLTITPPPTSLSNRPSSHNSHWRVVQGCQTFRAYLCFIGDYVTQ